MQKTTYHILGEDIEVGGPKDALVSLFISSINVLGKVYYDEVKKQGLNFPDEVEYFLKEKFLILERDRKINSIIE